jgi:cytidyltransferase-like protein
MCHPGTVRRRLVGSLIRLKPEFTEQYIALHANTFPGVLARIAASNIQNYSIYLHDGLLFGYYEYVGEDFAADMAAMGTDETTRQWWTLTDQMQEPLEWRAPGDWWAVMNEVGGREETMEGAPESTGPGPVHRMAFAVPKGTPGYLSRLPAGRTHVFEASDHFYCYCEVPTAVARSEAPAPLREVFRTDGCAAHTTRAPRPARRKRVFVSGCFDMLHSGHVAFLKEAATYGDVHVGIGSDQTIHELKGRYTVNSQDERRYMIDALDCVAQCRINTGRGHIDFERDLDDIGPDILLVNEDGHTPAKEALCRTRGIDYVVLARVPHPGLPPRSTTMMRTACEIPFRIDLAGGWLDQPYVSQHHPGPVITISIEPTIEFNDRSGMASSTRRKAIELWRHAIPHGDRELLARTLFSYENPPGTKEVAGSQDALGIVLPGLNRLHYEGGYWPARIESVHDEAVLSWLEQRLYLVTLGPRISSFHVLDETRIDEQGAEALADAADDCWKAVLRRDAPAFGNAFRRSFDAQIGMFPLMVDAGIREVIEQYRGRALGWKLSGAGGGGYLILVSETPIPAAIQVLIRRPHSL